MSDFTEPAYDIAQSLSGTIDVSFAAGASSDFVATLTAGTYHTGPSAAGSYAAQVAADLQAADVAAGNTGVTWTASDVSSGLSHRTQLHRLGLTGDEIDTIEFPSSVATMLGFSGATLDGSVGILTNFAPSSYLTGDWQRGALWLPRAPLTYARTTGTATVAATRTSGGSVTRIGYGRLTAVEHVHVCVRAALVTASAAADSQYVALVSGLDAGDQNAALERLWRLIVDGDGDAPAVRYYQDASSMGTYTDLQIYDEQWDADFSAALDEVSEAPLQYMVTLRGWLA